MMEHRGRKLTIRYCEAEIEATDETGGRSMVTQSWVDALADVPKGKRGGIYARFIALRNYLADGNQLRSPDRWNTEGDLPDGKHFYAIKVDKIRAYGWFSTRHTGVFYISHFTKKRGQKLAAEDTKRVVSSWRKEEHWHE